MKQKHFFEVGNKVQLRPKEEYFGGRISCFCERSATIKRIELCPDPSFLALDYEEWRRGPHQTLFWVEVDGYQYGEVPFRYRDLQPL